MKGSDTPDGAAGPAAGRVYDFWLGGQGSLAADRELARAVEARFPFIPVHVRAAREFHLRAGRWCAEQGVTRFIGTGIAAWMPGARNVLDAAREVAPGAVSACVCRSRGEQASARALSGPGLHAVLGRAERPAAVLAAPPVAAMLAEGRPVSLALGLVLQFAPPAEAAALVAAYAAALPPGSVTALSVALVDRSARAGELMAMFTPARVYQHTAGDVEGWLEGAGLEVVRPGAVDVRALLGRVSAVGPSPPRAPGMTAGALGRKP